MKHRLFALLAAALILFCATAAATDGSELSVQMISESEVIAPLSANGCTFQCKLVNNHPSKTVRGVDLTYTAFDSGRTVSLEDSVSLRVEIEPQASIPSPTLYVYTPDHDIAFLVVSVQAVYFTDGSSETIDFARGEKYKSAYCRIH